MDHILIYIKIKINIKNLIQEDLCCDFSFKLVSQFYFFTVVIWKIKIKINDCESRFIIIIMSFNVYVMVFMLFCTKIIIFMQKSANINCKIYGSKINYFHLNIYSFLSRKFTTESNESINIRVLV